MSEDNRIQPIEREVTVPVLPERAFRHFVQDIGDWWPSEYTWSGGSSAIAMEPLAGGHCFESGPGGFRCDWGTVMVYETPQRLVFSWQIMPDRTPQPDLQRAGSVEVRFRQKKDGSAASRVKLVHGGFERYGGGGEAYRAALDAPDGWTYILARYAGYCDLPMINNQ